MPLFGLAALVVFILGFIFEVFGGPDWGGWPLLFLGLSLLTLHIVVGSVSIRR